MTQQAKSASGPGLPRATPVSSPDWEQHRAPIEDLWITRAMSLEQLMDTMRREHNFAPSPMQYLQQLKKWDMHKSSPAQPSTAKRPHSPPSPDLGAAPDRVPSNSSPEAKRIRGNDTATQHGSHSGVLSPDHESQGFPDDPDQEGSEVEGSEVQATSDSDASPDSESQESSDDQQEDGPWLCFCSKHADDIAELSEALIQASSCGNSSSTTMDSFEIGDVIERVESAAEFFRWMKMQGDAFRLYVLLLKWAVNHDGPFCRCTRDLAHRARTGCAISALDRSDLEVTDALLDQFETKSISHLKDRESLATWLFYECLFTWKLYNSQGLISICGDSNWFTRLTYRLDTIFAATLCRDIAVNWLELGVTLCEELSPFLKDSDVAKRRLGGLLQRLQDSLEENPEPSRDYSMRMFHTRAVRYCLRWMMTTTPAAPLIPLLTRDQCHFRGGQVCTVHGTNPTSGPHPPTEFLACWARLTRELNDGSVPLWVKRLTSSGFRPTEFLAVVIISWEIWFDGSNGNRRTNMPWCITDEEIVKELRRNHVQSRVNICDEQILKTDSDDICCRGGGRELVRDYLAVTQPTW